YERTRAGNRSTPSFGRPRPGPLHTVRRADQAKGAAHRETRHWLQLLLESGEGHEKLSWPCDQWWPAARIQADSAAYGPDFLAFDRTHAPVRRPHRHPMRPACN